MPRCWDGQSGRHRRPSAQQITQAAERAAGLTRQLLAFSRRQLIQPKHLDMNKIVGNMTDMLGRLLGEDIALQLNYCQSTATVEADAGMMEQVPSQPGGQCPRRHAARRQLGIRIAVVELNEAHVQLHPEARVGTFVCISKSDTGCGIRKKTSPASSSRSSPPRTSARAPVSVSRPFTALSNSIRAGFEVESQVGKGTTFRVYIPYVGSGKSEAENPRPS